MIDKIKNLRKIMDTGVIAVIRASSQEEALEISEAVKLGGIDIVEITLTVPDAISVIGGLRKAYGSDEILLGAGTVLDPETARAAILAGAEYIVCPNLNPEVIRLCNRYQKICMPGCLTPTEIVNALELGADVIKLFPGTLLGPDSVKALKGPLPQAEFVPTGGVTLENADLWIKSGCLAVGVGGELTKGARTGDFRQVTETAKAFVSKVRQSRDS